MAGKKNRLYETGHGIMPYCRIELSPYRLSENSKNYNNDTGGLPRFACKFSEKRRSDDFLTSQSNRFWNLINTLRARTAGFSDGLSPMED
jgi:hypothetical protein